VFFLGGRGCVWCASPRRAPGGLQLAHPVGPLGFWAAGYYGRGAVLLIASVASFALIRGVGDIVLAFRVRELQQVASV
jgi:hypothetical protein